MPKKVLIVDDNEINRLLLSNTLQADYDIIEATDGKDALDIICNAQGSLSAVLLDIVMPEMDGYEVLRRVRDNVDTTNLPIIMVTGSEDEESRTKALLLGANDFVIKPYNPDIIKHCVKNNIALYESSEKLNAVQKDRLTGLYSREAFFDMATEMISTHESGYYMLSCFDIDNFKIINDRFGTAEGDRILRTIGKAVNEIIAKAGGIGGRISGDNFAVLVPAEIKNISIADVVQKAQLAFSDKQSVVFSTGRYIITDTSLSANSIYDRAYIAKKSVKGRYDVHIAYFDESMLETLINNQHIISDVDAAVAERQFEVWYQPQRNHITGALVGAEALVRWRHPEKGLIPPGIFIPLFEQNGFVYELDKYVWEEVCRQLRIWIDGGKKPVPVSVNISRQDIFRPDLIDTITGFIDKYSLSKDLLRLEITESAFSESAKLIADSVKQLVDLGFTVEIDDFGSGYSSLNTLKSVPAQVVKLDMRFLESDNDAERGGNILSSIVRMTKWLGMSVIAEGVEEKAQADYLASIGCSYIQGYYYAKPMPVNEYEKYYESLSTEGSLHTINAVDNLDNNSLWDPNSIDTLIFSSFVGGACIFEYHKGEIELLRANRKFAAILGDGTMSIEDTLKLDWINCLTPESRTLVREVLKRSSETKEEYTNEYIFTNIPNAPEKTYLRGTMRVIAVAGDRILVYCTSENITAQREAELREKLTSEQITAIMRGVGSGITAEIPHENGNTTLLFSNDKYYELLGCTREQYETEGNYHGNHIHPDDRDEVRDKMLAAYKAQKPAQIEFRVIHNDGSVHWVRVDISSTRFSGIDKNIHLCIFNDMTAEKEYDQKLLETDEQLRFLNSMSHELLAQTDTEAGINAALTRLMRYFDGNRAYIFEFNDTDMLASNSYEVCREDTSPEIENLKNVPISILNIWLAAFDKYGYYAIDSVSALDSSRADEKEILLAQGISSLFTVPLRRNGKLIGMMGVDDPCRAFEHSDRLIAIGDYISIMLTRRDLERRIISDNKYLSTMMNDMPGGFVRMRITDRGSLIPFFYNDGFSRLTGMSRAELIELFADSILNGIHPDDRELVSEAIGQMLKTGNAKSSRYRICHKTDSYIWVTTFGRIVTELSGEKVLNAYFLDMTEQVREEELQKSLMDNLPCGAGIYEFKDGQMSLTYQNKVYWKLVGLNEEAFPDSSSMSAVHPDDIPIVMQELSAAIENQRDVVCDIRLRHLTLGYIPVHLLGRIVFMEDGSFHIYATFTKNR